MPATLASLPAELHARIAAIYWNKVTEPYRFSRLTASHLTSRNYRLGFGRNFGRYITELDLSDLCTQQEEEEDDDGMDPTIVLDALLSLPNLHTVVTPDFDAVAETITASAKRHAKLNTLQAGAQVHFVMDALYELFAAVPSLVVNTGTLNHNFLERLALNSPQTRQLVLHDRENLDSMPVFDRALDALRLCPQLTDLKLVISEELGDDHEPLHQFVLPSGCRLRHFSASTWGGEVAPLFALVAKLSPVLHSLELDLGGLSRNSVNNLAGFPPDSYFPHLETLVITTTRAADLGHFALSILPVAFPALRHLELRTRFPERPLQEATLADLTAPFASRPLPLPPPVVISADVVSDDVSNFRLGDSQLPAMNRPGCSRRSLIPSVGFNNLTNQRHWAMLSRARLVSVIADSGPALVPLLDRMRGMVHAALESGDWVQLTRIAQALQPCELLRIERDA